MCRYGFAVWWLLLSQSPRVAAQDESNPERAERERIGSAESAQADFTGLSASPYANDVRRQYYETLRRSPAKALLWELALPGAGNIYTHIYGNAIVTGVITLAGAGLWIAGAAKHDDALWWAGMGTFAGGRVYGLVSAPLGAGMLNAVYRMYFGINRP